MSANRNPAKFIRECIFRCATQQEFADLIGVEQATVSRWETGLRRMDRMAQEKIRDAAKRNEIVWDNNWFFEVPKRPKNGPVVPEVRAA